jgi:hypothetical protein
MLQLRIKNMKIFREGVRNVLPSEAHSRSNQSTVQYREQFLDGENIEASV